MILKRNKQVNSEGLFIGFNIFIYTFIFLGMRTQQINFVQQPNGRLGIIPPQVLILKTLHF
jgi:hypothetical protein